MPDGSEVATQAVPFWAATPDIPQALISDCAHLQRSRGVGEVEGGQPRVAEGNPALVFRDGETRDGAVRV